MTKKIFEVLKLTTNITNVILSKCEIKDNHIVFIHNTNIDYLTSFLENFKKYCVQELESCAADVIRPLTGDFKYFKSRVSNNEIEEFIYRIGTLVPSMIDFEKSVNFHSYIEALENNLCATLWLTKYIHDRNQGK